MIVRRELAADVDAATAVEWRAFHQPARDGGGPPAEVNLLDALREDEGWIPELSLVAEIEGRIVGHAVCTRGRVGDDHPVVALGPIGVEPDVQRSGVGHALMHAMIGAADALGEPLIALLGSTDYYSKFGFVAATSIGVEPPEPLWGDFFQVRTLAAYDEAIRGTFHYATPFDDLP